MTHYCLNYPYRSGGRKRRQRSAAIALAVPPPEGMAPLLATAVEPIEPPIVSSDKKSLIRLFVSTCSRPLKWLAAKC